MDQGTLGAIATVLVFIAFIGVCWWAFSPKRKKRFDEDAQLPFADEDNSQRSSPKANDQSDSNDEQAQDNQADRRKGDAERQD